MQAREQAPGLSTLIGRAGETAIGALRNRGELLVIEWQEEKSRLLALLLWAVGGLFLSMMALALITGFVIFLFPPDLRLYVAAVFGLIYLGGAAAAYAALRSRLKQEPFGETIRQVQKDRVLFDSFK